MFPYLFTVFLSWRVDADSGAIFTLNPKTGIDSFGAVNRSGWKAGDGSGGGRELLAQAREVLCVRQDGDTWSYRSSHPECVPTCLQHWCSQMRTGSAGRDIP